MSDTHTYHLLVVDDEIANINLYKVVLSRLPVSVDTATSGAEAFDLLKTKQYDLVLLDLLMPDLTGIGLLQKAEQEGVTLPTVLVCSSITHKGIISQALFLGAGGYLHKPFTYQQLLQAVCDYLNLPFPQTGVKASSSMSPSVQSDSSTEQRISQSAVSAKTPAPFESGKIESLARAMSAMVFYKKTGKVSVHTSKGVGMLEYEKGRLKSVSYNGKTSIDALEDLRFEFHRAVYVELAG